MSPKPKPFNIEQWQDHDKNVTINKFIATAIKMPKNFDPQNPTKQLIHWRGGGTYMQKGIGRSMSYDMRKWDKIDPVVEVQLISKDYMVSSAAPYYWEKDLVKEFTTTDIYDLMVTKNFNQYTYNGEGSGCLTWTGVLVKLLETEGILPISAEESFLETVVAAHADPNYWIPNEPDAHFF